MRVAVLVSGTTDPLDPRTIDTRLDASLVGVWSLDAHADAEAAAALVMHRRLLLST